MRKYHQAALAIISTVSLVALVLYRNEYIKLRHVLEVFDYFGRPNDGNCSVKKCASMLNNAADIIAMSDNKIRQNLDEPIASWQRLNDEIYVYSAYAISDEEIRAVSFAKGKRLKSLSCKVIYENEIEPRIVGEFSYRVIEASETIDPRDEDNSRRGIYGGYELICRHNGLVEKNIAAVVFASRAEGREYDNEIAVPIRKLYPQHNASNDDVVICVASTNSRFTSSDNIANSIGYHNMIGVERFVVYDTGIPERVNNILKHLGRQSGAIFNLTYTTIPWNFPFTRVSMEVTRLVVNADCRYRLYNQARFVVTLAWNEYIFVKYHRKVGKLFRDIDETGLTAQRYGLSTIEYCQDPSLSKLMEIIGDDTRVDNRSVYIYRSTSDASALDNETAMKTRAVTRDVIFVHRYVGPCNRSSQLKRVDDDYVEKLYKNATTSPFLKLVNWYI